MNRISKAFEKNKAFIAFVTGGDPEQIRSLEVGAIIEISLMPALSHIALISSRSSNGTSGTIMPSIPHSTHRFTSCSDGAIVGSAIVKIVAKYGKECIKPVCDYVQEMKDAVLSA